MEFVWFRNDLRIHDHEPLYRALEGDQPVISGYLFSSRAKEWSEAGFRRQSAKRSRFEVESLLALHQQLSQLGVPLLLREGSVIEEWRTLLNEHSITRIHAYTHPGSEERDDEQALKEIAKELNIEVTFYEGDTLLHPDDLPFELEKLPGGFTSFRKKVEDKDILPRKPLPTPYEQTPFMLEEQEKSGRELMSRFRELEASIYVSGGEPEALRRLYDYYFGSKHVLTYKERRNGMLLMDDSSKFSPWLANGSLSPRTAYWNLKQFEEEHRANESTYWLWFELLWRDYFHFLLRQKGDKLFLQSGVQGMEVEWEKDISVFDKWRDGETGYPLIDAAMKQLSATGYMSNRARQNVASFLTKNLGIDWRWGAAWFESQLIDYDPASNYGNWQYVAGVGTDMRKFRAFHVIKQGERYDEKGEFVRHWLPALKHVPTEYVYAPFRMPEEVRKQANVQLGIDYPFPIVNLQESLDKRQEVYKQATFKK